jgi:ABC-type protease/lipase transport system fused ATPase/permease subunit
MVEHAYLIQVLDIILLSQSAIILVIILTAYFIYLREVKLNIFRRLWLVYISVVISLFTRFSLETYRAISYKSTSRSNDELWAIYIFKMTFTTSEKLRVILITLFLFDFRHVALQLDSDTQEEY